MKSNALGKLVRLRKAAVDLYKNRSEAQKVAMQTALTFAAIGCPGIAMAAGNGTNIFCYIAQYFTGIVASCALVVIVLWAIEHLFGVAKLHDVVIKVGVAAAMVVGGSALVTNSGLSGGCIIN